jgi:hypothetical protein
MKRIDIMSNTKLAKNSVYPNSCSYTPTMLSIYGYTIYDVPQ